MMPQEHGSNNSSLPTVLGGSFTAEEFSRLDTLRQNYYMHAEYLERAMVDRRLEFGRWLLEHGKLNEGTSKA